MVIALRIAADMKMNGTCRLTASGPIFHTQSYSFILPKNSRYTKAVELQSNIQPLILYCTINLFNNKIFLSRQYSQWRVIEHDLYIYWKQVYIPSTDKCNLDTYQDSQKKAKPIRLVEFPAFSWFSASDSGCLSWYFYWNLLFILVGK